MSKKGLAAHGRRSWHKQEGFGRPALCAHLEFLLRQFKVEGIKVALDVGHACGFGDDTGPILNGPPDQHLHTTEPDSML